MSFEIKWNPSPNFSVGRRKYDGQIESIFAIMDHQTAGKFPGCLSWLCNPQAQASAHYLVTRAGEIYQLVKDEDTAWHGGIVNNPNWNLYNSIGYNPNRWTIGIEHECYPDVGGDGNLTEIQYQASLWLHDYLIKKHNAITIDNEHIVGHFRVDSVNRPNCPGYNFPWDKIFMELQEGVVDLVKTTVQLNGNPIGNGFLVDDRNQIPVGLLIAKLKEVGITLGVTWDDANKIVNIIYPVQN